MSIDSDNKRWGVALGSFWVDGYQWQIGSYGCWHDESGSDSVDILVNNCMASKHIVSAEESSFKTCIWKPLVPQMILAPRAIIGSQSILKLNLLVIIEQNGSEESCVVNAVEKKLLWIGTRAARECIELDGIMKLNKIMKKHNNQIVLLEDSLQLFKRHVDTRVSYRFEILKYWPLNERNALQCKETGTEVMVVMINSFD